MKTTFFAVLIMLFSSTFTGHAQDAKASEGKKIEISGKVVALEENDKGDVISVEIATEDGKYFSVNNDEAGKALCKQVGKTVKVTGTLKTGDDGSEVLFVEKCEEVTSVKSNEESQK